MASDSDCVPAERPFVRALIAQIRAQDSYGVWEGKDDAELLAPFVLDRQRRSEIPIIGDPDPDTVSNVEQFYNAVALCIEKRCALMVVPILQLNPEGFGRIVLFCGRLVVVNKTLRDIHRFGFPSVDAIAAAGDRLVDDALDWIERHPAVAKI